MPNWPEGKRPKTRKDKPENRVAGKGKPTAGTEHPVHETHPGAREADPVTGEKPKPVRKPRRKKSED